MEPAAPAGHHPGAVVSRAALAAGTVTVYVRDRGATVAGTGGGSTPVAVVAPKL